MGRQGERETGRKLLSLLMVLLLFGGVLSQTACEQKTLETWAENALTQTESLIPLFADPGSLILFKEKLQTFIAHAKAAKTVQERAHLIIEFSEVVTLFRETVAPLVPTDTELGKKILKVDELLKNISRKVSCLLARARDRPEFQRQDIMQAEMVLETYAAE